MILPRPIDRAYLFTRKYYLDIFGKMALPQSGVHILNGHFLDSNNNAKNDIFYDTLNKLTHEVDFISFQEGAELIRSHSIPTSQKLLCLSFDDGYQECFTKLKPVLDAFNIKAGFFICPDYVEGSPEYIDNYLKNIVFSKTEKLPMSWDQIKTLHREGHLIGSHTLNHIRCNAVPIAVLDKELSISKQIIEAQLQAPCDHFAYTYGKVEHFSEVALNCAEQYYKYIYSQAGHRDYFSFNGRVINRRHFEGSWPKSHIAYYLNKKPLIGI